jgi:sn-glycerol 3-phosphate transport system permease protein
MRVLRSHLVLIAASVFMVMPLVLLLIAATRSGGLAGGVSLVPGADIGANIDRLSARLAAGGGPGLFTVVGTSLLVALCVAALTTVVSFLAAYALVFFRGAPQAVLWLTVATLTFPIEARMLPTFDVANRLGLLNSVLGIALPVLPLALGTLVFRQHFRSLPPELFEAARLDGARPMRIARDMVVPLSLVPAAAVALIAFLIGWNQYLWPLMILPDNARMTVVHALGLAGAPTGPGAALAVLAILPPLVLVLGFGRLLRRMSSLRG